MIHVYFSCLDYFQTVLYSFIFNNIYNYEDIQFIMFIEYSKLCQAWFKILPRMRQNRM